MYWSTNSTAKNDVVVDVVVVVVVVDENAALRFLKTVHLSKDAFHVCYIYLKIHTLYAYIGIFRNFVGSLLHYVGSLLCRH